MNMKIIAPIVERVLAVLGIALFTFGVLEGVVLAWTAGLAASFIAMVMLPMVRPKHWS